MDVSDVMSFYVVHKELLLRRHMHHMCRVMIKRFGTSPYSLFFSAELHLILQSL